MKAETSVTLSEELFLVIDAEVQQGKRSAFIIEEAPCAICVRFVERYSSSMPGAARRSPAGGTLSRLAR